MRDAIGNRITKGNMLLWLDNRLVVEVMDVEDDTGPRVEVPGQKPRPRTPILTLKVQIPMDMTGLRENADPMIGQFVRVPDPRAEAAMDKALGPPQRGPAVMPERKN